jgi:hypothetical protein
VGTRRWTWVTLYELKLNQDGTRNAGSAADRKCSARGGRFDSVSPWVRSSPARRRTMEVGGRCVASWRCADTRDGAAALWTSSWSGKAKIPMEISGRNPGSALPISRRTYVTRRDSSKASCLGRAVRTRRPAGGRRGETRRDRGRRERESACNGALGYEIGREGHLCDPAALEPQPWADWWLSSASTPALLNTVHA